jgi:ABC-type sugar transport system ATPase subunit
VSALVLSQIEKRFGETQVLADVTFTVEHSEFVVLLGASGSGKSTLLRIIAGLEAPTSGTLTADGRDITDTSASERGAAMVFQSYALYPHMSVARNMGFALELAGMPEAERAKRVREVAEMLDLCALLDRLPKQLSGGQRQRVAIGRAVVREPKLFLFDEPLSNLDAALRTKTRIELKRLQQRLGTTTIYVTHDQVEAMSLATRVCVLNDGRIEQFDTPEAIYAKPATKFVAGFIGQPMMNFFEGFTAFSVPKNETLGLRPQELSFGGDGPEVTIDVIEDLGASRLVHTHLEDGTPVLIEAFGRGPLPAIGSRAALDVSRATHHRFAANGRRIHGSS